MTTPGRTLDAALEASSDRVLTVNGNPVASIRDSTIRVEEAASTRYWMVCGDPCALSARESDHDAVR